MKVNYKLFTKHAEKVAKTVSAAQPILKGINHDENGNITVTDGHRLYHAYNVNAPKNVILDAVSGEEMNEGNYPEINSLIPETDKAQSTFVVSDLKQFIQALKAMQLSGSVDGTKKSEVTATITGKQIKLNNIESINFSLEIDGMPTENEVIFKIQFLIDSAEMLKDMKVSEATIRLYGNNRPFTLIPNKWDDIVTLIMPCREV